MEGNMQQSQAVGTTQIMTWVMKIFGILGMIFIGISLVLPWGAYTIPGTNWALNLNPWGVSTSIPSGIIAGADTLFSDVFYINTMQAGITAGIVAGICMILVFIFAIITLLLSIKAFRSIGISDNKSYLTVGIFTIVTMALCVVGMTQATSYAIEANAQFGGAALTGGFGVSWGFILAIISVIFFFINFAIPKVLTQTSMGMQRSLAYQQPQVMYTSQQQPPVQQTPPPQQPVQEIPPQEQKTQQPQAGTHFCPGCGAQLPANTKFCPGCGAKI